MTITNQNQSSGLRFNMGKLPMHLISWKAIEEIAKVLQFGATKYAPRNWEKGLSFSDTFSSLQRHLTAWYNGEEKDSETGLSHMAHVLCNAMFLMHFILTGTGTDDRPKHKEPLPDYAQRITAPYVPEPFPTYPPYGPIQPHYGDRFLGGQGTFGSPVEQGYSGFISESSDYAVESGWVPDLQEDLRPSLERLYREHGRVEGHGVSGSGCSGQST